MHVVSVVESTREWETDAVARGGFPKVLIPPKEEGEEGRLGRSRAGSREITRA